MHLRTRAWVVATVALALMSRSVAQDVKYSGDGNVDGLIDIADVLALNGELDAGTTRTGLEALALDANQDSTFDASDPDFVVDILLGRQIRLPIGGRGGATAVSFWYQGGGPGQGVEADVASAPVSFWYQDGGPEQGIEADVVSAPVSFWFAELVPAGREEDALHLGVPSFERE